MAQIDENVQSELTIAIQKTHPTPSAKMLVKFLYVLNSGDHTNLNSFYQQNFDRIISKNSLIKKYTSLNYLLYKSTHGLRADRVISISDWTITIQAQAMVTELWYLLKVSLNPDSNLITEVGISPMMTPTESLPKFFLTSDQVIRQFKNYMQSLQYEDMFSGVVLIAKDDKIIFNQAYGYASKEFDVENKVDTKFNIASLTMLFTSVVVLKLIEEGKLNLKDPISKYLPDNYKGNADLITIDHLLTHTAGLGDYHNSKYQKVWWKLRTINDFVSLFKDEPFDYKPGESFKISNAGYILLGAIIERITKKDYHSVVKDTIFNQLEMENSEFIKVDEVIRNLAQGYTNKGIDNEIFIGDKRNNNYTHSIKGSSASGAYSTVDDLFTFALALKNKQLLGKNLTNSLFSGKIETNLEGMIAGKQSWGFLDQWYNKYRIISHSGESIGASSALEYFWDDNYITIILSNYDDPGVRVVSEKLRTLICRKATY